MVHGHARTRAHTHKYKHAHTQRGMQACADCELTLASMPPAAAVYTSYNGAAPGQERIRTATSWQGRRRGV